MPSPKEDLIQSSHQPSKIGTPTNPIKTYEEAEACGLDNLLLVTIEVVFQVTFTSGLYRVVDRKPSSTQD